MYIENEETTRAPLSSPVLSLTPASPTSSDSKSYKNTRVKSRENIFYQNITKISRKSLSNIRKSITFRGVSEFTFSRRSVMNISLERVKEAKQKVDEAVRKGKVFTVLGPYSRIREVLRKRGWVEKFYLHNDTLNNSSNRKSRSSSNWDRNNYIDDGFDAFDDGDADDDDYDDDNGYIEETNSAGLPPWEEDDGIYMLMSRMLKKIQPNLFWTLRKSQVDYKNLRRDQMINHHSKVGTFTTKTGLAKCLNQLRWFDDKEPDEFFPRCFIISTVEEKDAFIDDFHFTACMSLIKEIIEDTSESYKYNKEAIDTSNNGKVSDSTLNKSNKKILPKIHYCDRRKERNGFIGHKYLDMAIAYCEFILRIKNHDDIDLTEFSFCWTCDWDEFLNNYYKVVHNGFRVEDANNEETHKQCLELSEQLKKNFPQYDMEGSRNVWILKPGAKSRGRGITCYSRLNDVLKLLTHSFVANENRYIVQKYIERPLLIYNTKFDIRQWFMVTDWNPLTVWWFKDCYLRFCSQQYTLDDFNEAVHLSNNSIQHKYHNGPRSELLPSENMWDSNQFEKWMVNEGFGNAYRTIIQPGMKEAVVDVLLCVQDNVDCRKNTFELYGADFMVSENDLKPWLIEINSSPCMSPSTQITARLTSKVLEDVFKVILDRKENKRCETGRFELIYKQNAIFVPPYNGIDLKLSGISIKNPVASPVVPERKSMTKPVADSIQTGGKLNEVRSFYPTPVNEIVLTTSASTNRDSIVKSWDKLKQANKKSTTSTIITSAQVRLRLPRTNTPLSNYGASPSPTKSIAGYNPPNRMDKTSIPKSVVQLNNYPLSKGKYCNQRIELVFRPVVDESTETTLVPDDLSLAKSEFNDVSCLTNNSGRITKLPVVFELQGVPKPLNSKMDREYKLPMKVGVLNITERQSLVNIPKKDANLQKKQMINKALKQISNSQLYIQKNTVAKPVSTNQICCKLPATKSGNLKRTLSIINDISRRAQARSKHLISARYRYRTALLFNKHDNDINNNNLSFIKIL